MSFESPSGNRAESFELLSGEEREFADYILSRNARHQSLSGLFGKEAVEEGRISSEAQEALKHSLIEENKLAFAKFGSLGETRLREIEEVAIKKFNGGETADHKESVEEPHEVSSREPVVNRTTEKDESRLAAVRERFQLPEKTNEVADFRQQSKIIKAIETGDPSVLGQSLVGITDTEHASFMTKLAQGLLTDEDFDTKVIAQISGPESDPEMLTSNLYSAGKLKEDLNLMQGALYGWNRRIRDEVPTPEYLREELQRFFQKYPTPRMYEAVNPGSDTRSALS